MILAENKVVTQRDNSTPTVRSLLYQNDAKYINRSVCDFRSPYSGRAGRFRIEAWACARLSKSIERSPKILSDASLYTTRNFEGL